MSEPRAAWAEAFASAQAKLPPIPKNRTAKIPTKAGSEFSYKYADLTDIVNAIVGTLTDCGLSFAQSVAGDVGRVEVTTRIYHVSGHCETFGPTVLPAPGDARAVGSAITYARRYALAAALGIAPDEDDDGAAASEAVKRHREGPPEPPPPPSPAQGLAEEMAALHGGDVDAARATTVAIAKELGLSGQWASQPANVNAVLNAARERLQNPGNRGGGPASEQAAGNDSVAQAGAPASSQSEEQWSTLYDLLAKDPIAGTVPEIEQRTRHLYGVMRGLGIWPDQKADDGRAVDRLHWNLMAWETSEHMGDLRVKANYQRFATKTWAEAQEAVLDATKREEQ